MYRTEDVEAIRTPILYSITSVQKSCHLWDKLEKYGIVQQATDASITLRPIDMQVGQGKNTDTAVIFNTHCFIIN